MAIKRASQTLSRKPKEGGHNLLVENVLHISQERQEEVLELPVLPIRNTVLIPNVVTALFVGRDQSMKAIEDAMSKDRTLFVVTQLHEDMEDPGPDDVYTIGVEGVVDRLLKMPDGTTSILIRGQRRLRRLEYTQCMPFMRVHAEAVYEEVERTLALEAL